MTMETWLWVLFLVLDYNFQEKEVIKASGERFLSDIVSDFRRPRSTLRSNSWEEQTERFSSIWKVAIMSPLAFLKSIRLIFVFYFY